TTALSHVVLAAATAAEDGGRRLGQHASLSASCPRCLVRRDHHGGLAVDDTAKSNDGGLGAEAGTQLVHQRTNLIGRAERAEVLGHQANVTDPLCCGLELRQPCTEFLRLELRDGALSLLELR